MRRSKVSNARMGIVVWAAHVGLVGACGCAPTTSAPPAAAEPVSGAEAAPEPADATGSLVERRPGRTYEEERARRYAVEEVEARAVLGRLPTLHLGMPFDDALLLLGIDPAHLLIRGRGAHRVAEYARASHVLELTYAPARGSALLSAVMYTREGRGSRVEVARVPPSVRLAAPAPDAQLATPGDVRFAWTVAGEAPVTLRLCADPACASEVASFPDLPVEQSGEVALGAEVPAGAYYWSAAAYGVATEPRRLFVGAAGPDFEPFAAETRHAVGEPLTAERRVRLLPGGPFWTARFHRALDDAACVLLVLRLGDEARYLALEGTDPERVRLRPVYRPDRGQSLMLTETRLREGEATYLVHLVEDEGQGPRRVFRAPLHRCAAAAGCDPRTRVRGRFVHRDADGDGAIDVLELTIVVGREETLARFPRDAAGRYALPPDSSDVAAP